MIAQLLSRSVRSFEAQADDYGRAPLRPMTPSPPKLRRQPSPSRHDRLTWAPVVPLAEGFRTPAFCRRAGLDAGPAFESLAGRKPRGGRGAVLIGRDLWI